MADPTPEEILAVDDRVFSRKGALADVQAIQAEYDGKPNLIPVAGWAALRERLRHADVARVLAGKEAQG